MNLLDQFIAEQLEFAQGCTEPSAVAYAVAAAAGYFSGQLRKIIVEMDGFVYKNGMTTGLPGVEDLKGNRGAAALGFFASKPEEKKLEVLAKLDEDLINQARNIIELVELKPVAADGLYIHVILEGNKRVESLIQNEHSNLLWIKVDGKIVWEKKGTEISTLEQNEDSKIGEIFKDYSVEDFVQLVKEDFSVKHFDFLKQGLQHNFKLVEESRQGTGKGIGRHYEKVVSGNKVQEIAALIAHGVDARMSGAVYPALASSGSGNQGITISLGIYYTGKLLGKEEEKIFEATLLGHLLAYYIKLFMGRLSAFCGLFHAAAPAIIGALLYLDDLPEKIEMSINNIYSDIAGVLCDGAKSSCALKAISAYNSAFHHYLLLKNGYLPDLPTGFVSRDLRTTLRNLRDLSLSSDATINETLFSLVEKTN